MVRDAKGDNIWVYNLSTRNNQGERLVKRKPVNSQLNKKHHRRLHTWSALTEGERRFLRNQNDFSLLDLNFTMHMESIKPYPGAHIFNKYNSVVMDFKFRS